MVQRGTILLNEYHIFLSQEIEKIEMVNFTITDWKS